MTERPTLAVVVERLKNIHDDVKKIEVQTTLTNGRVTELEKFKERFEGAVQGGVKTASFSWSVLGAIFSGITAAIGLYLAFSA